MSESKEHILKTSLLLFLQKSYREVTMKEIVQKTGLSKGAFYHYFASKEELFREIVLMFFSLGAVNYDAFPKQSLKAFIDAYLLHTEQSFYQIKELMGGSGDEEISFNFFFIMFEAMNKFPEFLQLELDQYRNDLNIWEEVIRQAKQYGEIKSDSTNIEIANLFLYCTDGVFIRVLNSDKQAKYKDKLKEAFYTVYNNL